MRMAVLIREQVLQLIVCELVCVAPRHYSILSAVPMAFLCVSVGEQGHSPTAHPLTQITLPLTQFTHCSVAASETSLTLYSQRSVTPI